MALVEQYIEEKRYTEEEYFEIERVSFGRWEYVKGEVRLMAGGSDDHNTISMNIGGTLRAALLPKDCRVYGSDMKIHTGDGINTFPDVAVICGDRQYYMGREDVILNPLLIVEVLSSSTASYDRGDKFDHYKTIHTFQEYLLVDQDKARVVLYSRQEDHWDLREVEGIDGSVFLSSIEASLTMADIYAKIKFDTKP